MYYLIGKDHTSEQYLQWGLEATIATFYSVLPDAPGVGIKSPASEEWKIFIHDTSQGARCLKKGAVVLYNCGVDDSKNGAPVKFEPEEGDACDGKCGVP